MTKAVGGSVYAVWRVLWFAQRQRSRCVITDQGFAAKAADIVGLYLSSLENALVISVTRSPAFKPWSGRQGMLRRTAARLRVVFKSTYQHHGTLNLFAALQAAAGNVTAQITVTKRREDFLGFMDTMVAETPLGKELHVILDNYCTHKKCDAWLAQHSNVHFHFTPTSASWLN